MRMKFHWIWRNLWKYAVVLTLLFLTFDVAFWKQKRTPLVVISDFEQSTRIINAFSMPNLKHEPPGQFLSRDWTADISARPLLPATNSLCGESVELFIGVISKADARDERRRVRESWAHKANYNSSATRIVFFVGNAENVDTAEEQRRFNDVVHIDVDESYYNLSLKTYAVLKYQQELCPSAKCVLKIDSDVVANIAGIEELCRRQNETPTVTGHCHFEWLPLTRDVSHKFYVPRFIYPHENYPPYCYGAAYLFSGRAVASRFLAALRKSPFFRSENFRRLSEDAIFTGLLRTLIDVPLHNNLGFSVYQEEYSYWCPPKKSPVPLVFHGSKEPIVEWRTMKRARNGSTSLWSYDRWRKCRLRGTDWSSAE